MPKRRTILFRIAVSLLLLSAPPVVRAQTRVLTIQLRSELIGARLPYNVILPSDYDKTNRRYPTLYLLHGLTGHYTDWLVRTNLAEYAALYPIVIVMPEGGDGWYTDSATAPNEKYESYLVKELIPDVDQRFRTLRDRRARAIAGLSMGGYGALKFGLKYPELFSLAASMSGALDAASRSDAASGNAWDFLGPSIMRAFGPPNSPTRQSNDLYRLVGEVPGSKLSALPFFYLDCGTEDGFLQSNREMAALLLERQIPHEYVQLPGGHEWSYWDRRIREVLPLVAERIGGDCLSLR